MTPESAALDRAIARCGETITLRRMVGTNPSVPVDVTLQAVVRGYEPRDLVGGITQDQLKVILSPSALTAAQWPGGLPPGSGIEQALPKKGDKAVIAGRVRTIEAAVPVRVRGRVVRIELRVLG